jgi:DNA repair exonuclease SbcCD nuclease subunit
MTARFIHTADWQIGKPFAGIEDSHKRALVQQERLNMVQTIGEAAVLHRAEFVLIAGDLFDTPTVTKATVSAACSALGQLGLPVFAIPGNHDHGGPASIWEQEFFLREQKSLAPNFRVLLTAEPVELDSAVLLPCPLLRRSETVDPTAWVRSLGGAAHPWGGKARIIVAHGSTQGFGSEADDDEAELCASNQIDLALLDEVAFDYLALGDWHGMKKVAPKAWYSGTPELDRFPKGESNEPGHVLAIVATRGGEPDVAPVPTARFGWHRHAFDFSDDCALARLEEQLGVLIGSRTQADFLRLELTGSLGIEATTRLEEFMEALRARLLRLKLSDRTVIAPTAEEIDALSQRAADPLISRVAAKLVALATGSEESAAIARVALRELHAACRRA